ncbi:MAG: hypothetical protein CSB34_00290 [Desulfobulbus propionicus]|nr:MAG: hypothetical protein CSB34_00290 [Desulfobulbus propionicus]
MRSVFQRYSDEQYLRVDDFVILKPSFIGLVEELLPVPAQVSFLLPAQSNGLEAEKPGEREHFDQVLAECMPEVRGDTLVIPLKSSDEVSVGVIAQGIDPALLRKMGTAFLGELQEQLQHRLTQVRLCYISPKSGMYNKRAAKLVCQYSEGVSATFMFFSVSIPSRTGSVTINYYQHICHLLQAICPGYLFSFDVSVFGVLLPAGTVADNRHMISFVQGQLKRDGIRQVQVGYATDALSPELIEQAWEGLLVAEKRGPFGICDAVDQARSPFQFPSEATMAELSTLWFRQTEFGVGVVQWESHDTATSRQTELSALLGKRAQLVAIEQEYAFVFFPEIQDTQLQDFATALHPQRKAIHDLGVIGIGLAAWPLLKFSKKQTVAHCFKALRHCSFLEPGSSVVCDFVSFNISGDYFFDQGDFYAAAREYRLGLQLQPDDVNLLNSLGVTLVEFNQYTRAISCFKRVLEAQPDDYMALVNLGRAQLELNQKQESMATLERARKVIPDGVKGGSELFLPLGRLYTEFGQTSRAIEVLLQWAEMVDAHKEYLLFRLLSKNHFLAGNYPEAISAAQQALHVYPRDNSSLSLLGVLYILQGQGDDIGLRLCAEAIELDAVNPENYYRQAFGYFLVQQFEQALDSAQMCLKLKKGHIDCGILVAKLYIQQGEKGKARRRLQSMNKRSTLSQAQKKAIRSTLKGLERKG